MPIRTSVSRKAVLELLYGGDRCGEGTQNLQQVLNGLSTSYPHADAQEVKPILSRLAKDGLVEVHPGSQGGEYTLTWTGVERCEATEGLVSTEIASRNRAVRKFILGQLSDKPGGHAQLDVPG